MTPPSVVLVMAGAHAAKKLRPRTIESLLIIRRL
jgi:hypothetical protein